MRLKTSELALLEVIYHKLTTLDEPDLCQQLGAVIARLKERQAAEREGCRQRAAKNRAAGYAWDSSIHPKKSKHYRNGDKKEEE